MRFAQPQFLWILLLALPLLTAFFYWSWRVKQKLIAQFVQARLLPTLTVGVSPLRQKFRLALLAAALAGVLFALAGPQWGFSWEEATQRGLDIIVAVDTSRSMLATDATPNRLEKSKLAAFDLMRLAKEDRLGLLAFAGTAFLQCPLTLDDEAFRQSVAALDVGIIPQGGTAISDAIRTAAASFEKGNNNHKVIVLFTDGEDHDADAQTLGAAKEAAEAGVNIFTIGVGTAAGELLRVSDEHGNTVFVKDEDGNVVKSHLNELLLEQIATAAGGFYLPLRGADPMATLYSRGLAPLPKSESTTKLARVYHERYHWFLGFAVLCLVFEILLPECARSRRAPASASVAHPGVGKAAAILCLLLLPALASASSNSAYDKYKSGDYQGAYDEYSRLAGERTNDYRLRYDAGTAAYQAKQLDDAEKQLNATLAAPDIANDLQTQEHAYFNLGNTHFHQGESQPDPQKKQERWEQSLTNFSRALQLNTNDADARNNLTFVKNKLEELKRQQQQQQQQQSQTQQNQQKQDKNKDQQQQQQNQQNQNQQQNSGQQQQQPQRDQQKQPQDQKSDQDKQKDQQQKQQQQAQKNQDQQNKPDQVKPGGEDKRDQTPEQNPQAASAVPGQMTRQEAQQMLDAEKDDEKALIFGPQNPPDQPENAKIKDW